MGEVELIGWAQRLAPSEELVVHDDVELERLVRTGAAALAAATCRWLELLGEFVVRGIWVEHGCSTPSQWLSWAVGVAPSTAREHVRVALALRDLPLVRDRFAAGTVSYSKVRAITRVCTPELQGMLLSWADGAPAHVLARVVADAQRVERARQRPVDRDDLGVVTRWRDDGSFELVLRVDAVTGLGVEQHLDRLVETATGTTSGGAGDGGGGAAVGMTARPATVGIGGEGGQDDGAAVGAAGFVPRRVRAGDALVGALAAAVAAGPDDSSGEGRHLVVAEVPAVVLAEVAADAAARQAAPAGAVAADVRDGLAAGPSADRVPGLEVAGDAPAEASGGASEAAAGGAPAGAGGAVDPAGGVAVRDGRGRVRVLPRAWLARLVCTAGVELTSDGADGHPADLGRARRRPDAALRRAVRRRDRTCRFPGCHTTRHVVVHHVDWWSTGGPTDLDNLVLVCAAHHRSVHDDGWTLRSAGSGRWTFHPPGDADGRRPRPRVLPMRVEDHDPEQIGMAGFGGPPPYGQAVTAAGAPAGADPPVGPGAPARAGRVEVGSLLVALATHARDLDPTALQPQHWDGWGYDHGIAVEVLLTELHGRPTSAVA